MKKKTKHPPRLDISNLFRKIKQNFYTENYHAALVLIESGLDIAHTHEESLLFTKASALHCLEQWKDLGTFLRYLVRRFPNNPEVWYDVADFHFAHGRWRKALQAIKKAEGSLAKKENYEFLEFLYGMKLDCLMALGETTKAIKVGRTALKRFPKFTLIRSALASIKRGAYKPPKGWANG